MPKYRITNWSDHQHYKNRAPAWIKLHNSMLSSRTWVTLDDASRVLAVASMLLASRSDTPGEFDGDPEYFQRVAYLNSPPDFNPLIQCGFLEVLADASKPLASACLEERRGEERESASAPARNGTLSRFVPDDWQPNPLTLKTSVPPGVNAAHELEKFRLHEFSQPKSDWDRAFAAWLKRAGNRQPERTGAQTVGAPPKSERTML